MLWDCQWHTWHEQILPILDRSYPAQTGLVMPVSIVQQSLSQKCHKHSQWHHEETQQEKMCCQDWHVQHGRL